MCVKNKIVFCLHLDFTKLSTLVPWDTYILFLTYSQDNEYRSRDITTIYHIHRELDDTLNFLSPVDTSFICSVYVGKRQKEKKIILPRKGTNHLAFLPHCYFCFRQLTEKETYLMSRRFSVLCTTKFTSPFRSSQNSSITGGEESTWASTESWTVCPAISLASIQIRTESPSITATS